MDRLLVCAARFLASAALCRYSSDRDDMQGEHWKDASVPQIHRTMRQVRRWSDGHGALRQRVVASPGPSPHSVGRGAYAIRALPDLRLGIVSERLGVLRSPLGVLLC